MNVRANGHRSLTASDATQINQPVMVALARSEIFSDELARPHHQFKAIEERHLGVMRALLVSLRVDYATAAKTLIGRVQLQNGVSANVAREHLYEAESLGLVEMHVHEHDRRVNLWNFRPGVADKLDVYGAAVLLIAEVVRAQLADPTNARAGATLLPSGRYFNILDPAKHEDARSALSAVLGQDADA